MKKPIVLCIMDGIGIAAPSEDNAYFLAKTPTLDMLKDKYSHSKLITCGLDVGLPAHQMGNSEVGHLNIGAGRVVYQSLTRINKAIEDKSFYQNAELLKAMINAQENKTNLHLMGLLSDGGVHSHIDHLKAIIKMSRDYKINNVYIHAFMDGRDTLSDSGVSFLKEIIDYIKDDTNVSIASISGRYYAMDRDKRYERNELAYNAMVLHTGLSFNDPVKYIEESYQNDTYDEFILPAYNTNTTSGISDKDSVIFYNFRPDRAIQIASIFSNSEYEQTFEKQPKDLTFVCMMKYDNSVNGHIAFVSDDLENVLGKFLSDHNYTQLRIAETEKYAHVTFFFDGQVKYDGVNMPELKGCKRVLINSPKVATYDLQPEMSASKITDALLDELDHNEYDVVILNFANGDMVGHTGKKDAAIIAVETVDKCIKRIYEKIESLNGTLMITADHGNCEELKDKNGHVLTSHTLNEVEFIVTKDNVKLNDGRLADIAPTILELMNVEKPIEMTGVSLINKED